MKLHEAITQVHGGNDWWSIWAIKEPSLFSCAVEIAKMLPDEVAQIESMADQKELADARAEYAASLRASDISTDRAMRTHAAQGGYCYGSRCACITR